MKLKKCVTQESSSSLISSFFAKNDLYIINPAVYGFSVGPDLYKRESSSYITFF